MDNLNERITPVEARRIMEAVDGRKGGIIMTVEFLKNQLDKIPNQQAEVVVVTSTGETFKVCEVQDFRIKVLIEIDA